MTVSPNMSIYIPSNGQELFSNAFLTGMLNVDAHNHTGGPDNGVQLGTDSILDGAITPEKLSQQISVEVVLTTTDNTPSAIGSIPLDFGKVVTLEGIIYGQKQDGTAVVGGQFLGTFRRASAGNVLAVSLPVIDQFSDFSPNDASFTLFANTSTQAVDIRVTGPAATTVNWKANYRFIKN